MFLRFFGQFWCVVGLSLLVCAPPAMAQASALPVPPSGSPGAPSTPPRALPATSVAPDTSGAPAPGPLPTVTSPGGASAPTPVDTSARNPAAKVNLVDGTVRIIGPDRIAHLSKVGDQLYEGDAIVTGDGAEIHLDMADGGFIAVRPNTQMRISKYQANGDSSDVSVIGLLKGSLRSITGWIGKTYPRKYAVITPNATIGVRGTDHEPAYLPDDSNGTDSGTYDTVHDGKTTIANEHGTIDVTPGRAAFVDRRGVGQPRVLDRVPAFFSMPRRHDDVFVGMHQRIAAGLEQRRTERLQQHHEELQRRAPAGRPLEHSLSAPSRTPQSEAGSHGLAGLRERFLQRFPGARTAREPEAGGGQRGQSPERGGAARSFTPARPAPHVEPPNKEPPRKQPSSGEVLPRERPRRA